jgi:ribose/xylose/arabinose/galactoside ABC-type transport system permease subunit
MKKSTLTLTEVLYLFCFLLFLFASDMTHIENGSELSLWLMSFAVVLTMAATLFPWLGIRWLIHKWHGSKTMQWLSYAFQVLSWGTFGYAMILRWARNLNPFHWWITVTALLWAIWILFFFFHRNKSRTGDKLYAKGNNNEKISNHEINEES